MNLRKKIAISVDCIRLYGLRRYVAGSEFSRRARWFRAWRYATGRLTEDDTYHLRQEIRDIDGYYPIAELSRESVLKQARERWGDNPNLVHLTLGACERVYDKWSGSGYEAEAAEEWAMKLIQEYAKDCGVELVDADSDEVVT